METYSLKKGLKKFKERGHQAAVGEMKQLHDRVCFCPINPNTITTTERKKTKGKKKNKTRRIKRKKKTQQIDKQQR